MTDYRSRTSLTGYSSMMREPDPEEAKRAARAAYAESKGKIMLIHSDWLKGWADKKQADILASKALDVKGIL